MPKRRVITSVINNYQNDQRVQKVVHSLLKFGFEVEVIATDLWGNPELNFPYPIHVLPLTSQRGMQMYSEFNRRLFGKLLKMTKKEDILLANDVDSLIPNYWISKIKKCPLVLDCHEIYSEMPSLTGRKFKKKIWQKIEAQLIPKTRHFYTVSQGCADWFEDAYGNRPEVIRNVPRLEDVVDDTLRLALPEHGKEEKILLYQGGINVSRGIDKMIQSMPLMDNAQLWIIGDGPKKAEYEQLVSELNIGEKVRFLGSIPPSQLKLITPKADLGLSLEEDGGISYRFSLPNKVFDYMHAGIPVLGTNLPEIKNTIETYKIGRIINNHQPEHLADMMKLMLAEGKAPYAENLKIATSVFNWENEEIKLKKIFEAVR